MFNPVSTYRVQFHKDFTFNNFRKVIPYLHQLGIKTIYASPIFEATPGSMHGYDVIDPLKINPEIGTIEELRKISKTLHGLGITWLQDIVPNHMAFDQGNKWLMDVLENGRRSVYAPFFDVLWESPLYDGKLMVPFLGSELDEVIADKSLNIEYADQKLVFNYGGQAYPLSPPSWLPLLKVDEKAGDTTGLENDVKALDEIQEAKAYSEKLRAVKERFKPVFTKAVTKPFLDKVNADAELLKKIAGQQHYQLCFWQETDRQINFRRFFTVNGLICLNMQDAAVFNAYHQFIKTLLDEGIFQGLRVDHIDGLYDPETYLKRLRALAGPETYIIVEKILEAGEEFPSNWPVQGNTGYDFLASVNNLFTNTKGQKTFTKLYRNITDEKPNVEKGILEKKALIMHQHMGGELDNLYRLFTDLQLADEKELAAVPPDLLKDAIAEVLINFPVYRFYGNSMPLSAQEIGGLQKVFDVVINAKPKLAEAIAILQNALLNKTNTGDIEHNNNALHFYERCMQFTGPLMAKGVEDTLMYTYNRFITHNEVGDSPDAFGVEVEEFHAAMRARQENWPLSMNATATHDTKRGEDVRSRLNVLTDLADEWVAIVQEWSDMNVAFKQNGAPDENDEYFIYQTIVGAYPMPGQPDDDFDGRIQEYLVKALREAKTNSTWAEPNEGYEAGVNNFIKQLLDRKGAFWKSFAPFHKRVADYGIINSLATVLLKYTCPGMPDLYQGCELWDLSLVDPDNRRPVDYAKRAQLLHNAENNKASASEFWKQLWLNRYTAQNKLVLTNALLKELLAHPNTFAQGEYIPLTVTGTHKDNVLAFARHYEKEWYIIALPMQLAAISTMENDGIQAGWGDTRIMMPTNAPTLWQNLLLDTTGHSKGAIMMKEIFREAPLMFAKLKPEPGGRAAGILMHISSLPSKFGIGDIGPEAKKFADMLHSGGQKYWQLLPVNPVNGATGYSPYSSTSSTAGNTLLISPELLQDMGLLTAGDLKKQQISTNGHVDFEKAKKTKDLLLEKAYRQFVAKPDAVLLEQFNSFKIEQAYWLNDYALYELLKSENGGQQWYHWPKQFKHRDPTAIDQAQIQHIEKLEQIKWLQFIFYHQWQALKTYCHGKDIVLFGDMPFYMSYGSADVWANPEFFNLDSDGNIASMAGVPPDYFSADGQLWGMPVYRWDELKKNRYAWWVKRIKKNLEYTDLIRLDHFRAFASYWDVPGGEKTAVNGKWVPGPASDFFKVLKEELGELPFVAEDLGDIDEAVYKLRDEFGFPGMRVLQFAFDASMPVSDHIPHNYVKNSFVYTGTHDNNTVQGWYEDDITNKDRKRVKEYAAKNFKDGKAHQTLIKLAYASVARVAIIPIQDVLGLDGKSRMNVPASTGKNWSWRLAPEFMKKKIFKKLKKLTVFYNR